MTVKLFEENLKVGDWVKGKSRNGELIYGYIQTINPSKKAALINVVKSDDEKMVGTTIGMMDGKIEKLPLQKTAHEEQILSLIDLALLTKDEAWFIELTAELKEYKIKSKADIPSKGMKALLFLLFIERKAGMKSSLREEVNDDIKKEKVIKDE